MGTGLAPISNVFVLLLSIAIALSIGVSPSNADEEIIDISNGVAVEMRDGIKTLADIYVPGGEGPFPTILSRVPYGTQNDYISQPTIGRFWVSQGYVYVAQNVRGRFGSEGMFAAYYDRQEDRDGYDTVEWITQQAWSNGIVGVMGESYYGYTSLAAAFSGHPAIKAISPANITIAREKQTLDGAYPIQASGLWTLGLDDIVHGKYQEGARDVDKYYLPLVDIGKAHGFRDVLWRKRITGYLDDPLAKLAAAEKDYAKVRVPALHFGGWYDSFTRGSIVIWDGVRRLSTDEAARDQQWLVMGPWDHNNMSDHIAGKGAKTNIGKLSTGTKSDAAYDDLLVAFFDYTLKGIDNGFGDRPRVQYFNIGDNDWRFSDVWPPEGLEEKHLYLYSDGDAGAPVGGVLSSKKPGDQPVDIYQYDPLDPVTITEKTHVWGRAPGQPDRAEIVDRADVLTYMTAPLEAPLDITGSIKLELFASSSAVDTDFTAALVDVFPDGYSLLIQEGILRASFRDRSQNPTPIEPGQIYQFDVDMWATSYTVPAGHRLRLEVSSSNFPRFARNLNNGEPFGMSANAVTATQTIHHSDQYPSRLVLPVMKHAQ